MAARARGTSGERSPSSAPAAEPQWATTSPTDSAAARQARAADRTRSVSAFAPIAAPTRCPWGEKAFSGYLGADRDAWKAHDASELVARADAPKFAEGILIDQGLADQFLANQLNPDVFEAACAKAGQPLTLRRHPDYDHGYYFISTFIADHIAHHAQTLRA